MKTIIIPTIITLMMSCAASGLPTEVPTLSRAKTVIANLQVEILSAQALQAQTAAQLTLAQEATVGALGRAAGLEAQIERLSKSEEAGWKSSDKYQAGFEKEQSWRIKNGRERDIFLLAFAIAVAVVATSFARPLLTVLMPPYNLIAYAGCIIGGFAGAFYLGRATVGMIVRAIFTT